MPSVFQAGYHTESLGVEIAEAIPPLTGYIPRLTHLRYRCEGTAHTIYIMKCIASTTAINEAASGQANIVVANTSPIISPTGGVETIDSNDWCCYMTDDGIEANDIATVTSDTLTFNNNLGARVSVGALVYVFGEIGRAVHTQLKPVVSTMNDYADLKIQAGIPVDVSTYQNRSGVSDPLLLVVDNPTAAGAIHYLSGEYVSNVELTVN